jgi:NTE family protein
MQSPEATIVGLVLGGGGARGLAHLGVLRILEANGIPVHRIAGTSMGAIIGALYASGVSLDAMEAEVRQGGKLTRFIRLVDFEMREGSYLFKGNRIRKLLAQYIGEERQFSDLRLPFAAVTVDLLTGQEVVLREGSVVDAVRASMAVPGVFAPVEMGNMMLADGGVLNNVPVDVARQMGANVVIAVDVLPDFGPNRPGEPAVVQPLKPRRSPAAYQMLWNVQAIMISALTSTRLACCPPDVIIRPELPTDLDMLIGFHRPLEAFEAGEKAAQEALPKILDLVQPVTV